MSHFTYTSDEHGYYSAPEDKVAEVMNIFYFGSPMDIAEVQQWFEAVTGSPNGHYDDVLSRASFAVMIVSEGLNNALQAKMERENLQREAIRQEFLQNLATDYAQE
jgi:hypothetical protein